VSLFVIRLATVSGMVLGGYFVALAVWSRMGIEGWKVGLFANSIFFLASALLFTRLPSSLGARHGAVPSFTSDLRAALRLAVTGRTIPFVMISAFLFCLVGAAVYVLIVSRVQRELGAGTRGVSLLAGCVALGTITGAVLYSWLGQKFGKEKVICGSLSIVGILLVLFSVATGMPELLLLSVVGGLFLAPIPIAQDTLLHEHLSERERGRIFGIRDWVVNLFFAVGSAILGIIATLTSTRAALVGTGTFLLLGGSMLWIVLTRGGLERPSSP
jgi:MFS family permease